MDKTLPIYELTINEEDNVGVNFISIVDRPAIEKKWQVFNSQDFIKPKSGEGKADFLQRCIPAMINEGKDQDQAVAMCISMYDTAKFKSTFKAADKEKRIVSGAAMIANMPIYRRDNTKGEYFVMFKADTIRKIVEKYFRNKFTSNVNMNHANVTDGVYVIESMLIDKGRGIETPKGYDELPDGSWFVSMKVDNNDVWENFIKTGTLTGFSVEGTFIEDHLTDSSPDMIKKLIDIFKK